MRHTEEMGEGVGGMWHEYESREGTWGWPSRWVALTLLKQTAGNTRVMDHQALKGWTIGLDNGDGEGCMGMSDVEPEDG